MTTIVTRAGKGSPLTNNEVDTNFTNLNTAKIETLTSTDTSVTITGTGSSRNLSVPVNPNAVSGPASATDNAITRFDGTTGKLIQNSTVLIDDSGNATGVNSVGFDTTPATPPTTEGSLYWDNEDSIATLNLVMAGATATQHIGEETYYRIKASAAITNGQVVMFTGTVGSSGGVTGAPASGLTASTASYILGIATQNIPLNGWGYVTHFGEVKQINTSAFAQGAILYYDPTVAGGLTATPPSAPNAKVQVGAVVNSSATIGIIFVRPAFGGMLGQFEGDVQVTTPANGQLLVRDQTAGRWVNATLTDGTGINITEGAGSVTIANTGVLSVSGTTGRITSTGGATPALDLTSGIATAGTTGSSSLIPVITVDTYGRVTSVTTAANPQGTVTSVTGTSPVVSSGGATPAISLAANYGDTLNPYASKTANNFLAAPNGIAGAPTFRAIVAADIPTLNQNTTGTATTATTANALNTANNYQVNSLGVGTAGSGIAGEIRATNNITAYFSSDRQFKENIEVIPNALNSVESIGGKLFDWTDAYLEAHGGEDEYFVHKADFGVIAQDVQAVFPRAVRSRPDGSLAVDYEKLVALAFAAIVELSAEVKALKAKVG